MVEKETTLKVLSHISILRLIINKASEYFAPVKKTIKPIYTHILQKKVLVTHFFQYLIYVVAIDGLQNVNSGLMVHH